ncbi:MAG: hypothetical protein Q8T11_17480 [Elusimicrobiota bacterium]|nr:hypothetical protein [Elusimicrobiota bacterium]
MKSRALMAFFMLALAAPATAGQVEAPVSVQVRPGGQSGSIGSSLGAPVPVQLTVTPLTGAGAPTLASALSPASMVAVPIAAAPAAAHPVQAVPIPLLPVSAVTATRPAALGQTIRPAAAAGSAERDADAGGSGLAEGAALFDQAKPSLWGSLLERLPFGERAPGWPGKPGDVVRVGGVKTTLDKPAGDGGTSKVWKSRDGNYAIKLLHPGAMALPGVREEAATLRALAGSGLPVARLVAESRDGKVLVKEFIEGATAHELLERGAFSRSQAEGWPELAAKLISAGVTADLARGNLVWQHWRTRWVIVDAGSLAPGGVRPVLDQLLAPELLSRAGLDAAVFLSGLRARLGPDSAAWARTVAELRGSKAGAQPLAELARRDAARPAAPRLVFGPAAKGPAGLDDTVVSAREAVRRAGYDALNAKTKYKLHGDDPGKLNTVILAVEAPGKTPYVVKIAQWDIVRNEVALRRLARRFFGRYFRVPASVAVKNGYESYMVMEKLAASPSHYKNPLNKEQRVAAALFLHTFGVSDVNPGNVLSDHDGGLPWLIDFEQAFGRAAPVAGRVPDERIALEMPWMNRGERNAIEDYQPGVRAWREFLKKPETRAAIVADLAASGFTPAEAAGLLARFDLNAADLDWTLQNDADFVNQFVERNAAQR